MAIVQNMLSMDDFYESVTSKKLIVNDIDYYDNEELDLIKENLITQQAGGSVSAIPTCACGTLSKFYLEGRTCQDCGTLVQDPSTRTKPYLWLKTLDPTLPFFNPAYWTILRKIVYKKVDIIRYLCDPLFKPINPLPAFTPALLNIIGERSYANFVLHLKNILIFFKNTHSVKTIPKKQDDINYLIHLLDNEPKKVFAAYLPIINKQLFVMENTTKGRFTNIAGAEAVIDVTLHWIKTCSNEHIDYKKKVSATTNAMVKIANLYESYGDKFLYKKPGAYRKHIFGSRSYFTFRTTITSIPGRHKYDEIHAPWVIGVTAYRPQVLNKLVNQRGYSYKDANVLLFSCVKRHDPIVQLILDELVAESPYPEGLPVIMARNPGLAQGSTLLVWLSKFKSDPKDYTSSVSALPAKATNHDFDGDQINYTIVHDNEMVDLLTTLATHHSLPTMDEPCKIGPILTMDKPANAILGRMLSDIESTGPNLDLINELVKLDSLP